MKFEKTEIIPWYIFNELWVAIYLVSKNNMLYKYEKTDFSSVFPTNVYDKILKLLLVK